MADLDHLKQINDKLGHAAGDDAIISAANILKKAVEDNGIVCRSGGDEFYIIYTRKDDEDIEAKRLTIKGMCEDFNKHSTRKFILSSVSPTPKDSLSKPIRIISPRQITRSMTRSCSAPAA